MRCSSKIAASLCCLAPMASAQVQYTKLYAVDGVTNSYFGDALAFDGNRLIVGAPSNAGVSSGHGAAYAFVRSGTGWTQEAKLINSNAESFDGFARSVAIDGDRLIAGAPGNDGPFVNSGAAYVFVRTGGQWVEEIRLEAEDAAYNAGFGSAVAIEGDTVLVGADNDPQLGDGAGAAYVFRRTAQGWQQEAKLHASDAAPNRIFGFSVALEGGVAVVGSKEASTAGQFAGAAYVFESSGAVWTQRAQLLPPSGTADQHFGTSVAKSGERIAVGAPGLGQAHLFVHQGAVWATDGTVQVAGADFGERVAIDGERLLVGAPHKLTAFGDSGAAYLYRREAFGWVQQGLLVPNDAAAADRFGISVGLAGSAASVGALFSDGTATDAGAAYVLAVNSASATIRTPCVGGSIPNSIAVTGAGPVLGTTLTITVNDPTNAVGLPPTLTLTTLALSLAPAPGYPCGLVIPGWGSPSGLGSELLVSATSQDLLMLGAFKFWLGPAFPNGHSIGIPNDLSIVGLPAFAQGAFITPTVTGLQLALTQAVDMSVGL